MIKVHINESNPGHAGRPGQVGGSAPSGFSVIEKINQLGISHPAIRFVDSDKGFPVALGSHTKEDIVIIKNNIIRTLNDSKITNSEFNDWFYGAERNEKSLTDHVIAHEIGHAYYRSSMEFSKELYPSKGGGRIRRQLNPMVNSWKDYFSKHEREMSWNSRYGHDSVEGFADAFSAYINHPHTLPIGIRNWFNQNLK